MSTSFPSLFPGLFLDAADRFAQDHATTADFGEPGPITEMGWALTLVPEEAGGAGGTLADLAGIVEGLATHGVQLPVVETCAVAPLLLQGGATHEAGQPWLQALAEGTARISVLAPLSASLDEPPLQVRQLDIGFELTSEVGGVDQTLAPTHYLVPAVPAGGGDTLLFIVEAARLGPPVASYRTMEGRTAADFRLQALALPASACIGRGAAVQQALVQADNAALLLTAVDTVAALAALIRETVRHLQERRQFGVALASFQVLRHRTADLYVRYLAAKGLVLHALHEYEARSPDLRRTLRLAKVSLAETARQCAEAAIQMHGGMGVSEEVLATRLAQRLIASEFRYGDRLAHAQRLHDVPTTPAAATAANARLARSAP